MVCKEKYLKNLLQSKPAIFSTLVDLGDIIFTDNVETAEINFNKKPIFKFNPSYWDSINDYEKLFVICHECLHVLFNHGYRIKGLSKHESVIANIASDIVINTYLLDYYKFNRNFLSGDYFYLDNAIKDIILEPNHNFEYYFNILKHNKEIIDYSKAIFKKRVNNNIPIYISAEDYNNIKNIAGKDFNIQNIKIKNNTKNLFISDIINEILPKEENEYNWLKPISFINDFILPTHKLIENLKKKIYIFIDSSYSCINYQELFFNFANSIPKNKCQLFCYSFDTIIYDVNLEKNELIGGGETRFDILSDFMKDKIYDYIFVFTDGKGSYLEVDKPLKWHWVLCGPNVVEFFIPPKSKVIKYE